jgi:Tfp pilus assembly protein PilF
MAEEASDPVAMEGTDRAATSRVASLVLPYQEAKRRKSSNRHARWSDVLEDLSGEIWPQVEPSFKLRPGQTVFTIGSCFARNIEANLAALGCRVPMLDLRLPPEEFDGLINSAMNKFHPPSFRQCLEWTARIHDRDGVVTWKDCKRLAFEVDEGSYYDLDMAGSAVPVTRARFVERRQHIYDILSTVFEAGCLMMTPGLIEAWKDMATGLYMYGAPYHKRMLATPDRWRFEVLSFQHCLDDMLASIDVVRARNPQVDVLVTTSPVPLSLTFTGRDIVVANAHSKAVLRAVCDAVLLAREGVDYFPSYEMVTQSDPRLVWKGDRLHVAQGFIGKIVGYMLDNYLEGVDAVAAAFQKARSLLAEGDHAAAVIAARGVLEVRPDHLEARIVLGQTLVAMRQWDEAAAALAPALEADAERADARVLMARALAGADHIQEAVARTEEALSLSSLTIGDVLAMEGLMWRLPIEDAVRLCRRALERFPRHMGVYPLLAESLGRAGDVAGAIEMLQRAVAMPQPPPALHLQLAQLLLDAGEVEQALARLDACLSRDPKNKRARAMKAALLADATA